MADKYFRVSCGSIDTRVRTVCGVIRVPSHSRFTPGVSTELCPVCGSARCALQKCQERRIMGATACGWLGDIGRDRRGATYREEWWNGRKHKRGRNSKWMLSKQKSWYAQDRLKQVETFKYPGSMISENDGCEEEVRHGVGAGWGSGETCRE